MICRAPLVIAPATRDDGASMQSRKLALATGLTYHVLEWDGPGDLTFVLVHGFADHSYMWNDVAERLAPHGHVIAPDLRGHGDSDWIGGDDVTEIGRAHV